MVCIVGIYHTKLFMLFSLPKTFTILHLSNSMWLSRPIAKTFLVILRNICSQASLVLYLLLFLKDLFNVEKFLSLYWILLFCPSIASVLCFGVLSSFLSRGMWALSSPTPCTGLPKEDLFSPSWDRNQYELEVERWGFSLVLPLCNCGKVLSFRPQFLCFSTIPLGKK